MKYLLILALIGCTTESNPLSPQVPEPTPQVERVDEKLCRLPEEVLDSLIQAGRVTDQDIRRCRPLSEYGL